MYRYLSLSSDPLREGVNADNLEQLARELSGNTRPNVYKEYCVADYASILNTQVIAEFAQLGLTPKFVVVWANQLAHRPITHAMIHTDLTWHDSAWATVPCGVNWELSEGSAEFYWLANRDQELVYPPEDGLRLFNAIHYGERGLRGGYSNFDLVASARITSPMLVRTDVPHSVAFDRATSTKRINISVRFGLEQINSWESAVDIFSTVVKQE